MDFHEFIEKEIIPQYAEFDAAHREDHVRHSDHILLGGVAPLQQEVEREKELQVQAHREVGGRE